MCSGKFWQASEEVARGIGNSFQKGQRKKTFKKVCGSEIAMLAKKDDRKLKKMPENKNDLDCYTEARNLWLSPRKMNNIVLSFQRSEKWRWCLKSEKQQDDVPRWLRKFVFLTLHTSALYCTDAVKTPRKDTSALTLARHSTCREKPVQKGAMYIKSSMHLNEDRKMV